MKSTFKKPKLTLNQVSLKSPPNKKSPQQYQANQQQESPQDPTFQGENRQSIEELNENILEGTAQCEITPDKLTFIKTGVQVSLYGVSRNNSFDISTFQQQDIKKMLNQEEQSLNKQIILRNEDLEMGEIIGRGAAGSVQKAFHIPTQTKMAIKIINIYDPSKRKQVENDLESLFQTDCPFLIKLYGGSFSEGQIKLALELMDLGSCKTLQNKLQDKVPENILAKMALQILGGLMYLHRVKHIVHRDIKPDNVLMSMKGQVKLSDFGIIKQLLQSQQLCNTFIGTYKYMSPERMQGKKYSYSSDIWSFGLVIYELGTNKFPYPKFESPIDAYEYVCNSEEPALSTYEHSEQFCDFISKCLKKDPSQRWTAIQLAGHPWITKLLYDKSDVGRWLRSVLGQRPSMKGI